LAYAEMESAALNPDQVEAVQTIVSHVQRLPLALEIMGKLARRMPLIELSVQLDLALDAEEYVHCKGDKTNLCAVLLVAEDEYIKEHPRAHEALVHISYLDPDHFDAAMLSLVMEVDKAEANKMLMALAAWSVIKLKQEGGYSVHRLIQDAARKGDENNQIGGQVVERLDAEAERVSESGAYKNAMHLIPTLVHIVAMGRDDLPLGDFPNSDALGGWAGTYMIAAYTSWL
jgi:hypothetical protein